MLALGPQLRRELRRGARRRRGALGLGRGRVGRVGAVTGGLPGKGRARWRGLEGVAEGRLLGGRLVEFVRVEALDVPISMLCCDAKQGVRVRRCLANSRTQAEEPLGPSP